jgi:TetR/AcrR family transcriptional regulator, regulator of biofilm formation and stress response
MTEEADAGPRRRRQRRVDPDRRERILDAAIDVIAERGVAGTTHRRIAGAADVPLGSLTYHFASLEELRAQAFARLAERASRAYAAHFDGVGTTDELVDAVTDLVHDAAGADASEWVVTYELYLAALREPALRSITEGWMQTSRTVLERFVDPSTARGFDALIEGLIMHRMLSTAPFDRTLTRAAVRRALTLPEGPT